MIKTTSQWLFRSNNFLSVIRWLAIILGLPTHLHSDCKIFVNHVCHLRTFSGPKYTIQVLKESHRILAKYLAGEPTLSAEIVGVGINKLGIPRILPLSFRKEIETGSIETIRFSLTILSFYRAMYQVPEMKLKTITDPAKVSLDGIVKSFASDLPILWSWLKAEGFKVPNLRKPKYQFIYSAGPNGQATIGAGLDALAILLKFPRILKFGWDMGARFALLHIILLALIYGFIILISIPFKPLPHLLLGKLSLKEEAAGKVRVFAIADYWTQSFMRPLHNWAFDVLRQIPQDGTFNHRAKAKEVGNRLEETGNPAYSLDLTAATDRFPVLIQEKILGYVFGDPFASLWRSVLVDRSYFLKKENQSFKYAVGQPMGSLSSWSVFALSHHLVVQWAHYRTGGKSWFHDYAIIGDDVVIMNTKVAEQYLVILNHLGVGISMHKSLTSKTGVFEFAKQIHYKGLNLSAINPNEAIKAFKDDAFMVNWVEDLQQREFQPDFISVARSTLRYSRHGAVSPFRKVGGMPYWSRRIVIALTSPFGPFPVKADKWININAYSLIDLANSLIPRDRFKSKFAGDSRVANANLKLITQEWDQFCRHNLSTFIQGLESASQLTLGFLEQTWFEKLLGWVYMTFMTPFPLVMGSLRSKDRMFYPELARARFGYGSPAWPQSLFDLSFPLSETAKAYRDFKRSIDLYRFSRQIAFSLPTENSYSVNQGFGYQNPVMGGALTPFGDDIPKNDDMISLETIHEIISRDRAQWYAEWKYPYGCTMLAFTVVPSLALIGVCLTL